MRFIPNGGGRELVCVGASGLQYSSDAGENWQQLHPDKTLYTIDFLDEHTAIAAGKDKMIRIEFKK